MDPINDEMLHSDSSYASDVSDDGSAPKSIENPKYKCKYCPKRFAKTQALGGHQNAHRKEREMTKRQQMAVLAHLNQPDPDPYPYTYLHLHSFPNLYGFPPGFELPIYRVERPDNLAVVYNQYIGSPSSNFAGLPSDPSQGISRAFTRLPLQPQPQPQPQPQRQPLFSALSPVCLDLSLGVGSSSQTQAWRKEPNDSMEKVTAEKEDDVGPSLSLSLKL